MGTVKGILLVPILLIAVSGHPANQPALKVPSDNVMRQFKREMLDSEETSVADRIAIINYGNEKKLYEADIVLTDQDRNLVDLSNEGDVDGPLSTITSRNAERLRHKTWRTKRVPYEIEPKLISYGYKSSIENAIKEFHSKTCIKWVPKTSGEKVWVRFVYKKGCWSYVGRQYTIVNHFQELSLGPGCNHGGTIMHEMMHAVGFWHEQSRPDRNQYVEVMWENIIKGKEHNFNKYSHGNIDSLNVGYDYNSIMHYGKYGFSANGQPTLQAIGNKNQQLGQRNGFSKKDILQLNALYDCSSPLGGYSQWSQFGPCDNKCYHSRQRYCTNEDKSKCPGADLHGIQTETIKCPNSKCYKPVDGHWGRWSHWSDCSVTCGKGTKNRVRKCDDPPPKNGGSSCVGPNRSSIGCFLRRCGLGPDDCQFDFDNFCFWTQDKTDTSYWDWLRHQGPTSSSNTGPNGDHTTGKGHYVFFESSKPANTGDNARLLSKVFPATNGRCMTFWYSMYGKTMGSFRVWQLDVSSGTRTQIWEKSGNQGQDWHQASLTIKNSGSYKIIFEGIKGPSFQGDIGLDDVYFKETPCSAVKPVPAPNPQTVSCNFDKDDCGWENKVKRYKWLRHAGSTPSPNTGPAADHTTGKAPYTYKGCYGDGPDRSLPEYVRKGNGNADKCYKAITAKGYKAFGVQNGRECWSGQNALNTYAKKGTSPNCRNHKGGPWANDVFRVTENAGYYMYLPAVGPARISKSGLDVGKTFPATPSEGYCLSFWYSMNGQNMGTLNIYAMSRSQKIKLWSKSGNQGKDWKNARISLKIQAEYRILFEGVRGNGKAGDIAIDDFALINSPC